MHTSDTPQNAAHNQEAVFVTVALALHPREGRSKHARVNLPVGQLHSLTDERARDLIHGPEIACGVTSA
jgi:hypothetical protein